MPSIPSSVQSMSWSAGPTNRMYSRTASAPYMSASWSGAVTLPFDFDIFVPPWRTQPWWNSRWNGSRKPTMPCSFSTLTKKRE